MTFTAILIAAIVMLTLERMNAARAWKHIANLEREQFGAPIKNRGQWHADRRERERECQP